MPEGRGQARCRFQTCSKSELPVSPPLATPAACPTASSALDSLQGGGDEATIADYLGITGRTRKSIEAVWLAFASVVSSLILDTSTLLSPF